MKKSSENIENIQAALQKAIAEHPVTSFLSYRAWLENVYEHVKGQLTPYSYQKFSADVGLGSSNAHLVVMGKRKLTQKTGKILIKSLGLSTVDAKYLGLLIGIDAAKDVVERDQYFMKLMDARIKLLASRVEKEELEFFTEWYHAAIIELLRLPHAEDNPEWLSRQLNPKVALHQVKRSLELLNKLGYLNYRADKGRLFPTDAKIKATASSSRLAVLSLHNQMLDLAKVALTGFEPKRREIATTTLAVSDELFEKIKKKMVAMRNEIIESTLECPNPNKIAQVSFQLFPLCDDVDKKRKK